MQPLPPDWAVVDAASGEEESPPPNAHVSRIAPFLAVGVALIGAVVVAAVVVASSGAGDRSLVLPSSGAPRAEGSASDRIVVEVVGAVRHPGLVRIASDSRVADAIAAAGGYSPAVDVQAAAGLNLAKPVADGDQVHVPARGEATTGSAAGSGGPSGAAGGPVNVNSATEQELDALPGIGPVTAGKIIAARTERPFSSVDELRDRKVLGSATLEKIRALIVVH